MPLDGSAGFSRWTEIKQADFTTTFAMLVAVAANAAARMHGHLVFWDATAGPGIVDGSPGSPLIMARILQATERSARVYCFERDPSSVARLRTALAPFARQPGPQRYTVVEADHADGIPWFIDQELPRLDGPLFGLLYVDANARTDLSFEAVERFVRTPRLSRVDLLLNVAATDWWKRIRAVGKSQRYFYDDIRAIPKQYRWFRKPVGPSQWTMVLLSNYPKLAPSKRSGFHAEYSAVGQEILATLNETKPERLAALQPMLPFGDVLRTEPTGSISDIRDTGRFAPTSSADVAASANDVNKLA